MGGTAGILTTPLAGECTTGAGGNGGSDSADVSTCWGSSAGTWGTVMEPGIVGNAESTSSCFATPVLRLRMWSTCLFTNRSSDSLTTYHSGPVTDSITPGTHSNFNPP